MTLPFIGSAAMVSDAELIEWLAEDSGKVAELCEGREEMLVDACPGWTFSDLVAHVAGNISGWYTYNLTHTFAEHDAQAAMVSAPPAPDDAEGRLRYLCHHTGTFLDRVKSMDLDSPTWVFGRLGPARTWLLRAATETTQHLWDLTQTLHIPYETTPARTTQSVEEMITAFWTPVRLVVRPLPAAPKEPLGIEALDSGYQWTLAAGKVERVDVNPDGDIAPEATIAGSGLDLSMWMIGRIPTASMKTTGPTELIDRWNVLPLINY